MKGRMKIVTMKRAFYLFWRGLSTLVAGVAGWLLAFMGMADDSRYSRITRRVISTCFAILAVFLVVAAGCGIFENLYYRMHLNRHFDEACVDREYVSSTLSYCTSYDDDGFLKRTDGTTTIKGIQWIARPLGTDSLVCYSDGQKRGYFNLFTGLPVMKPQYSHAWIFSDGLAAVDDEGMIKFIDASGRVVMDPKVEYAPQSDGYVFHNGYCIIQDGKSNRYGMIDRQGKWVLEPQYFYIRIDDDFWIVDNGKGQCVVDSSLHTVVPYTQGRIFVLDGYISVTLSDHSIRRYNLDGTLVDGCYVNEVYTLCYDSDELRYPQTKYYNDEGELVSETDSEDAVPVEKAARCRSYEAETGWYGLMSPDGRIITPPSYTSIKAIAYDLYLCKDNDEDGVILNGKGERIR